MPEARVDYVTADESLPYHVFVEEQILVKLPTPAAVSVYLAAFADGWHYAMDEGDEKCA
jgi:hypothetical protein